MNKRIKTININYKNSYILINKKYYIDVSIKNFATVYNMQNKKDIPQYIFNWMIDNKLIKDR